MKILPRKEFERAYIEAELPTGTDKELLEKEAKRLLGYHTYTGEVILPLGASTGTKLHELGHEAYGHGREIDKTIEDEIFAEIEAAIYSWEARGKKLTYRVGFDAVKSLLEGGEFSPKTAVYWVSLILIEDFGIPVPNEGKRELIRWAKGRY